MHEWINDSRHFPTSNNILLNHLLLKHTFIFVIATTDIQCILSGCMTKNFLFSIFIKVVVKFIKKAAVISENWVNDETMGLVPREICLLARLNHPNIVQVTMYILCIHINVQPYQYCVTKLTVKILLNYMDFLFKSKSGCIVKDESLLRL